MAYSGEVVYLSDYYEEAEKVAASFGVTNRFKTHIGALNSYLGGGFGVADGYEIIILFGETGVGKSTVVMNMIAHEAMKGTKIGYMLLEDDVRHFILRLKNVIGQEGLDKIAHHRSIQLVPKTMLRQMWKLEEILQWIRDQADNGVELFVIDHLQFVFENNAEEAKNEYHQQRKFMRDLNALLDEKHVTVLIVSHINKGQGKGMERIVGSSGIAGAGSKVIGIYKVDGRPDSLEIFLHKSRHTPAKDGPFYVRRKGYRLFSELDGEQAKYEQPTSATNPDQGTTPF